MIFLIYYYDILPPPPRRSFLYGKEEHHLGPLLSIHFMRTFFYQIDWLLAPVAFNVLVFFLFFFNFSWGNKVKHQSHNCSNCVAGTSTCTTIAFTINEKGTLGTTN